MHHKSGNGADSKSNSIEKPPVGKAKYKLLDLTDECMREFVMS